MQAEISDGCAVHAQFQAWLDVLQKSAASTITLACGHNTYNMDTQFVPEAIELLQQVRLPSCSLARCVQRNAEHLEIQSLVLRVTGAVWCRSVPLGMIFWSTAADMSGPALCCRIPPSRKHTEPMCGMLAMCSMCCGALRKQGSRAQSSCSMCWHRHVQSLNSPATMSHSLSSQTP